MPFIEDRICKVCGKTYLAKDIRSKTCSKICGYEYQKQIMSMHKGIREMPGVVIDNKKTKAENFLADIENGMLTIKSPEMAQRVKEAKRLLKYGEII